MRKILLSLCGLLLFGVVAGYVGGWIMRQSQPPAERIPIVVEEDLPERKVQLYFGDKQGRFLQSEERMIAGCEDDRDCIRSLLEALRSGSQQALLSVLPEETGILEIELENDLVRVNFSRHLSDFHPGGSFSELLTVYSLANSLGENFPYLRQVQILIDGQVQRTLKGHVRIDQPVYADFSYTRPPTAGPVLEEQGADGLTTDMDSEAELKIEEVIEDAQIPAGD